VDDEPFNISAIINNLEMALRNMDQDKNIIKQLVDIASNG